MNFVIHDGWWETCCLTSLSLREVGLIDNRFRNAQSPQF